MLGLTRILVGQTCGVVGDAAQHFEWKRLPRCGHVERGSDPLVMRRTGKQASDRNGRRSPEFVVAPARSITSVDPAPIPTPTRVPLGRRRPVCTGWITPRRTGSAAAKAAFVLGLLYAAVSVYWALGGTWLLATVGGALPRQGRAGTAILVLAVWAAVVIKTVAAVLPLLALRRMTSSGWHRAVSLLAWIEAGILTVYGLVLTVVGLLVQAGTIHLSAGADHRALAWHAYLWDPWFLIWGLLVAGALRRGPHPHSQAKPTLDRPTARSWPPTARPCLRSADQH